MKVGEKVGRKLVLENECMNRWQHWHQVKVKMFCQPTHNYINARLITVYISFPYKCISPGEQEVTHNMHTTYYKVQSFHTFQFQIHIDKKIASQLGWPAYILNIFDMKCKNISHRCSSESEMLWQFLLPNSNSLTHTFLLYMHINIK